MVRRDRAGVPRSIAATRASARQDETAVTIVDAPPTVPCRPRIRRPSRPGAIGDVPDEPGRRQARRHGLRRAVQGRRRSSSWSCWPPSRSSCDRRHGRRSPTFTRRHRRAVPVEYVGPLVFGTIWAAFLALVIATPLAVAVALFTPLRTAAAGRRPLGYFIDLLAAVPSVVYGLWGIAVLAPVLARSVYPWLEDHLGFIPLFEGPASTSGRTMMTVGVVLAVMILPIITAISREVFLQTPRLHEEASLALGATRWEMIRQAVLPYGRSGVISGAMLGSRSGARRDDGRGDHPVAGRRLSRST